MSHSLQSAVRDAIAEYLHSLDGEAPVGVHKMVMGEVESVLLSCLMEYADGNQSHVAAYLGINRGTLRKKLKEYGLI